MAKRAVLLLAHGTPETVSYTHLAIGAGAAADGGHRCDAREHAAGFEPGAGDGSSGDYAGMVRRAVCDFAANFPMEMRAGGYGEGSL